MILQQEAPYTAFDGSGGYEPPDPSPTLDQRETSVQTPCLPSTHPANVQKHLLVSWARPAGHIAAARSPGALMAPSDITGGPSPSADIVTPSRGSPDPARR